MTIIPSIRSLINRDNLSSKNGMCVGGSRVLEHLHPRLLCRRSSDRERKVRKPAWPHRPCCMLRAGHHDCHHVGRPHFWCPLESRFHHCLRWPKTPPFPTCPGLHICPGHDIHMRLLHSQGRLPPIPLRPPATARHLC